MTDSLYCWQWKSIVDGKRVRHLHVVAPSLEEARRKGAEVLMEPDKSVIWVKEPRILPAGEEGAAWR